MFRKKLTIFVEGLAKPIVLTDELDSNSSSKQYLKKILFEIHSAKSPFIFLEASNDIIAIYKSDIKAIMIPKEKFTLEVDLASLEKETDETSMEKDFHMEEILDEEIDTDEAKLVKPMVDCDLINEAITTDLQNNNSETIENKNEKLNDKIEKIEAQEIVEVNGEEIELNSDMSKGPVILPATIQEGLMTLEQQLAVEAIPEQDAILNSTEVKNVEIDMKNSTPEIAQNFSQTSEVKDKFIKKNKKRKKKSKKGSKGK